MLRRYSSNGVENLSLGTKKTIGAKNSDICIPAPGVADLHAVIELHPLSRTFWLRDISLTLATSVNGRPVSGQVELHEGDLLRFGAAQPMVFQHGQLIDHSFPNGDIHERRRVSRQDQQFHVALPVLGKRIEPSASRRVTSGGRGRRTSKPRKIEHDNSVAANGSIDSSSEISPTQPAFPRSGSISTGANLLQRVVRLQSECAKKDDEILILKQRLRETETDRLTPIRRLSAFAPSMYQNGITMAYDQQDFRLEVYRSFITVVAEKLHSFNERVLAHPQKDYSEVFACFYRKLEEPFSTRMADIEEKCQEHLSNSGFDLGHRNRMRQMFVDDGKEKLSTLASELEVIMPVLRDATSIARDSIRATTVTTQWSRHLGDRLRNEGIGAALLINSIERLKEQFATAGLSRHWLPPSLAPLFKLIASCVDRVTDNKHTQTDISSEELAEELHACQQLASVIESLQVEKNELQTKIESERARRISVSMEYNEPIDDDDDEIPETPSLDDLLKSAELRAGQLRTSMELLSEGIQNVIEMDTTFEKRLDRLVGKIDRASQSVSKLRSCERKISGGSILSLEVRSEDVQSGLQQLSRESSFQLDAEPEPFPEEIQQNRRMLRTRGSDRVSTIEEEDCVDEEVNNAMKGLRTKMRTALHKESHLTADDDVLVLVARSILMDIIADATEMLETTKNEENIMQAFTIPQETAEKEHIDETHHEEEHDDIQIIVPDRVNPVAEETFDESTELERPDAASGSVVQEETFEERHPIDPSENYETEVQPRARPKTSKPGRLSKIPVRAQSVEIDAKKPATRTRFASVDLEGLKDEDVISNHHSTFEMNSEEDGNKSTRKKRETSEISHTVTFKEVEGDSMEDHGLSTVGQKVKNHDQVSRMGRETSREHQANEEATAIKDNRFIQIMNHPGPGEAIQTLPDEPVETIHREEENPIDTQTENIEKETTDAGSDPNVHHTQTEEPLTEEHYEKNSETQDSTVEAEQEIVENEDERRDETPSPIHSTATDITLPHEKDEDEEDKLTAARRAVTAELTESLLNSAKPKNICDISHSAHIQSHINTSTKVSAVSCQVPVKSFSFFESPPTETKKKTSLTGTRPSLRQPRMIF